MRHHSNQIIVRALILGIAAIAASAPGCAPDRAPPGEAALESYSVGSVASLPLSLDAEASAERCTGDEDCQLDPFDSVSVSTFEKATMFVWVDRSTSMSCPGSGCGVTCTSRNPTRWNPVKSALIDFFSDPESAGLGVALRFWPDNFGTSNCASSSCPAADTGGGACKDPQILPGVLTAAPRPADAQEQALYSAINGKVACGNTPMHPALEGATTAAVTYKQAHPDEEVIVVFLTDGVPNLCDMDTNHIAELADDAFQGYGVRTYTIGISTESSPTQMGQIAAAGGGTAFSMSDGMLLQSTLTSAMRSIRGDVLP